MKKQVLICDDEEGVRESLKLILEDDYDLTFTSSGDEALAKIRTGSFDCMLLDIKMPTKNGLDTLEEARKISPNLKVIIVTGYQSVETASRAVQLGAVDYITKPFESSDVIEKVGRV